MHPDFTAPPYLGQVFVVVDHAPDERVRYKLAEAESAFSPVIKGEFRVTNVQSNAPPDVPRFELRDGKKHLLIAQSRLQLGMTFDSAIALDKAFDVAAKNAENFLRAASTFQQLNHKATVGFVIHINFPSKAPKAQVAALVAAQLYKGPLIGALATIDIRLGFESSNGLYRNFALNSYEVRQFDIPKEQHSKGEIQINIDTIPISEMGLACVLDINNKARSSDIAKANNYSFNDTTIQIIEGMKEMFTKERHLILPELQEVS